MSDCMDFIGNQYLLHQFLDSADPENRVDLLTTLVSHLTADGMSLEEACQEIKTHLRSDGQADAVLSRVRQSSRLIIG